jgi:hypothetical protein
LIAALSQHCKKSDPGTTIKISRHGSTESHKAGQDCMSCHREGASGKGWFTVAGSLFEADGTTPAPNGMVRLYNELDDSNSQVMSVEVDGKGNFYTTESLVFSSGFYTSVSGSGSPSKFMQTRITSGACNNCHNGTTTAVIRVD